MEQRLSTNPPRAPLRVGLIIGFFAILLGMCIVGYERGWLALPEPSDVSQAHQQEQGEVEQVVRVLGPSRIGVLKGSRLEAKLAVVPARKVSIATPILNVTGNVVAHLSKSPSSGGHYWDFATLDLANTYGDWVKSRADIEFAQKQAGRVRQLAETNIKYLTAVAKRKARLTEIGAEPEEARAAAEAEKLKAEIQGQKDIFEAETNVRTAIRTRDLLERQLLQGGVDPDELVSAREGMALLVADVPENSARLVRVDQKCEARFLALPHTSFPGSVGRIGPSLSKERRTLRVIFDLADPHEMLKPGMFAEIGLGTEMREVVTVPAEAVLHIAAADYVVVQEQPGSYRVVDVAVGEPCGAGVELRRGLEGSEEVVGDGAILLKPAATQALQPAAEKRP